MHTLYLKTNDLHFFLTSQTNSNEIHRVTMNHINLEKNTPILPVGWLVSLFSYILSTIVSYIYKIMYVCLYVHIDIYKFVYIII